MQNGSKSMEDMQGPGLQPILHYRKDPNYREFFNFDINYKGKHWTYMGTFPSVTMLKDAFLPVNKGKNRNYLLLPLGAERAYVLVM